MDLRPSFEAALDAFSLPAVVTPPHLPSVTTRAFWLPSTTVEVPAGADLRRAERRRVLALPLADVPQIVRNTVVEMAESEDEAAAEWRVDSVDRMDGDHYRVVVVPA